MDVFCSWLDIENYNIKALLHYALIHWLFLFFPHIFLFFFPAFYLAFLIPTCWYQKDEEKREKNARTMQENCPMGEKRKKMGFALATQRELNQHKKNEMYMANARNLRLGPNATYIPLTCIGVSRLKF